MSSGAPFSMNSFEGMRILALVRDGDYAHAGEEEAIELAMRAVPKAGDQLVLDAGCGRGGTAEYLRRHGWGRLVGFDIEPGSIATAQRSYPEVAFHVCDVVEAADALALRADVICLFNAMYCFPDQPRALRSLRALAKPGARLVIFDHVNRGGYDSHTLLDAGRPFLPRPLKLDAFATLLGETGWRLAGIAEHYTDYARWYGQLTRRIEQRRTEIAAIAGEDGYAHVHHLYSGLRDAARAGTLGAAVISATAEP